MGVGQSEHTASILTNGNVLVAGSFGSGRFGIGGIQTTGQRCPSRSKTDRYRAATATVLII
jgi:hypothetical protein